MIKIKQTETIITPTIFPDGTSQIWKLPEYEELAKLETIDIIWNFESEREIIDLLSLVELLSDLDCDLNLHIPYLPYARQDKWISNKTAFNLYIFGGLINRLQCQQVTTVDVHNAILTEGIIYRFTNKKVTSIQNKLLSDIQPHWLVFPDEGAYKRYPDLIWDKILVFEKVRNQLTGNITGHTLSDHCNARGIKSSDKFLIVDDICDGGATFLSIAGQIKQLTKTTPEMHLFVTHGIFSRGREILETAGLRLHTTNSLLKNSDGFEV